MGHAECQRRAVVTDSAASSDLPKWTFGDSPELADRLAALIVAGVKTASCSEASIDEPPVEGERGYLMSGDGRPVAILETQTVTRMKFADMTQELAALEGEGDLSLDYWQRAHRDYFTRAGVFAEDMDILFETFRLVDVLDSDFAAKAADHLAQERAGATQ
ncbi:MAG: ASCH domain-containing protein [Alphaproteobacteria bacterium]|nr:ASCH domain-containing protein [Hyphomonas sp.]MBR9808088.1 ASCH domain-containing protein [Alphaproteobacteria bacterium]